MLIGFGAASVAIAVFVVRRMDALDGDHVPLRLHPLRFARYLVWLLGEIARANWAVTRVILSPSMRIRQHLFAVPHSQSSDVGQVTFANSITLTPGTITVDTEPDHFLVHALAYDAGTPGELADMDRRVSAAEVRG